MEVAPLLRDFLGLQGSLSPDEAVQMSKLQPLHERYVAIMDDFSVQVNAKDLRMTPVERVMVQQLRLKIIQDWRRQLMDCTVQGIHQGGVDNDALEHKSDCACNDCKLAQSLDKYRSVILDSMKGIGTPINSGDNGGDRLRHEVSKFLLEHDLVLVETDVLQTCSTNTETLSQGRQKRASEDPQIGQSKKHKVISSEKFLAGEAKGQNVDAYEEKPAATKSDVLEDKKSVGSFLRFHETLIQNTQIVADLEQPTNTLRQLIANSDQNSIVKSTPVGAKQSLSSKYLPPQDRSDCNPISRQDKLGGASSIKQMHSILEQAAYHCPHLCIYRSLVKRLVIMYGSTEDDRHIPKLVFALVERLGDSMSATAFEFNGTSMLLRGTVILCEVNEYHNDLSLHRAEGGVPRGEWEVDWHQDCVDYVQVLKDHVTTTSTDSPPPSQTDVSRIMTKYVNVLPKTVRSMLAEFFSKIFPAGYSPESPSEWFVSIFECQRLSTDTGLAWWGDYKVQLRQPSGSDLVKRAKIHHLANLWSNLHNQHILRLFGASDTKHLFFVCEYFQQKTLAECSCDRSTTSEELITFLFQVSLALLSLEEQGVWCQTLTCTDVVIDLNTGLVKLDLLHVELSEDPIDGKSVELLRNLGDEAFALWLSGSHSTTRLGSVVERWRTLFVGEDQNADSSNAHPTLSEITCAIYMEMIQPMGQPLNLLKSMFIEANTSTWKLIEVTLQGDDPRCPCLRYFRPVFARLNSAAVLSQESLTYVSIVNRIADFFCLYANSKVAVQLALARYSIQVAMSLLEQLDDLLQSTQLTNQRKLWEKPIEIWRNRLCKEWDGFIKNGSLQREIISCTDNDRLEALTLIKYELVTHLAVMSESECKLYCSAFDEISEVSGMSLVNVPSWFTPSYRIRRDKSRDEGITIKCSSFSNPSKNSGWTPEEEIICHAGRWSSLHHRNVLCLLCASHVGRDPLMAFEGSDSLPSLREYLSSRKRKHSEMWQLLQEAAIGLAYLHKHQVIHRALSCDAILVCSEFVSSGANGLILYDDCTNGQQLITKSVVKLMSGSTNRVLVCAPAPDTEDQEVKQLKDMMIDDIAALRKCVSECLQYQDDAFADRQVNSELDSKLSDRARALYTAMMERKEVTLTHMIAVSEELFEAWKSVEVLDQLEQRVQHDSTVEMSIKDAEKTSIDDVNHMCQQLMEIRKLGEESDRTNSLLDRLKHLYSQTDSSQNANTQLKKRIVELISSLHQVLVPAENALIGRASTSCTLKKAMNISRINRQLDEVIKTFEEMEHTVEQQKVSDQHPKYDSQGSEQTTLPKLLSTTLDNKRKTDLSGVDNLADKNDGPVELVRAATHAPLAVINNLVDCGADVNSTDKDGWTALMRAACNGHVEVVRYLVEERLVDVNTTDNDGWTALMFSATNGHLDVVRCLVEEYGVDVNAVNKNGWTALMFGSKNGHLEVVRYLVLKGKADVNAINKDRWSSLMWAADKGHLAVVRCLVEKGGADVNATNKDGKAAIRIAADRGYHDIVRVLTPFLMRSQPKIDKPFSFKSLLSKIARGLAPLRKRPQPKIPTTSRFDSNWIISPTEIELTQLINTNNLGGEYIAKWLDANVIVKLFIPDTAHSSFQQEVKLWKQLRHPNVIKMYGACEAGPGLQFFVCEYADHGSLIEYVKSTPEDEPRRVWKYLYNAALGLEYLHERGFVHGDLRCNSILIGSDNLARLSNFGLSGVKSGASSSVGSMLWQAPEIMLGKESSSPFASDVYSLGMCILEAITGKKPWDDEDDPKWYKTCWKPETDVDPWNAPKCPDGDARDLVWRMCSQDPTNRIKMQSVVHELERLAFKESLRHSQSEPDHEPVHTLDTYKFGEIKELWRKVETHMNNNTNTKQYQQAFDELKSLYNHLHKSTHHITLFTRFHTLLTEFHTVITMNEQQTLAMRLSSTRATTNSIYAFHRRIQSLWVVLGQPVHTNITQMAQTDDGQRREMFVSGVSDVYLLLRELESDNEKVAFLEMLKREMTHQYTSTQLEVMKKAMEALESKISGEKDRLVPEWFIPWYELIKREDECLGEGGFGSVIRAKWLDSDVVVKQVEFGGSKGSLLWSNMSSMETISIGDVETQSQAVESKASSPEDLDKRKKKQEAMKMFRREVDIWFGFSHPHVIQLFGACHVGTPFFVCEYATNGTLVQYLRKHPDDLWQKLYEAALGVQYLHARGVVHGDLKGNNILVGSDLKAKVTDFGLSSMASGGGEAEISGASHWVAPECFAVDPLLTFASDVYSLGMCVVESMRVVGGEGWSLPWRDADKVIVRVRAGRGELPPRPSLCSDGQWELVKRMCAFQPEKRIKISTVVDELARLVGEQDEAITESLSLEIVPEVITAMKTELSELRDSGSEVSKYFDLWDELEKVCKNDANGFQSSNNSSSINTFCCLVKDAEKATLRLQEKKTDLMSSLERTMAVHALQRRLVKFIESYPYLAPLQKEKAESELGIADSEESFEIADPVLSSKVAKYLGDIVVSDHNPAVLFSWDAAAVDEFVKAANALADAPPAWFSEAQGSISAVGVTNDMVSYLALLGAGRCDAVLLAPNSLIQYGHLQERLQYMQYDTFLQACMTSVSPGRFLARTFVLIEKNPARAMRTRCLPPSSPLRPLFD